jgi:hypothetical protein
VNAKTLIFAFAALFTAAEVHAQEDEPMPAQPVVAVPDPTFRALHDRVVALRTRDGSEVIGQVLDDDAISVTLALVPSRRVCTVAKADVVDVRLADVPPVPMQLAAAADGEAPMVRTGATQPPERERHFGLNFGFSPSIDLDLDAGLFHGFVNANLVLPMASDGQILGFGAGGGVSFHVRPHSRWKLDVFAAVTPTRWGSSDTGGNWVVGFGVGLGAHYTAKNGFTIGFKMPVIGYSAGNAFGGPSSSGTAVASYYLAGLMGLPVVSLGYRF